MIHLDLKLRFATTACAVSILVTLPGVAHAGFLDQLFGLPQVAPPQPAYVQPYATPDYEVTAAPRVHRHRQAAVSLASQKQMPTDLMHDKTLRAGDAVMTKHGIEVYEGVRSSVHDHDEFMRLSSDPDLGRNEKVALLALDSSRSDSPKSLLESNRISTGRSAAVSSPLAHGYRVTDPKGRSVRYVGP